MGGVEHVCGSVEYVYGSCVCQHVGVFVYRGIDIVERLTSSSIFPFPLHVVQAPRSSHLSASRVPHPPTQPQSRPSDCGTAKKKKPTIVPPRSSSQSRLSIRTRIRRHRQPLTHPIRSRRLNSCIGHRGLTSGISTSLMHTHRHQKNRLQGRPVGRTVPAHAHGHGHARISRLHVSA
jgi:hypothetical protein